MRLLLLALSGLAIAAAPASASHPACPEWNDGNNAFEYPLGDAALGLALPACRVGIAGAGDRGTHALSPAEINMRREIAGLKPHPVTGQVRWTFVDSLGRPMAVLTRRTNGWETSDWLTGRVIYRGPTLSSTRLEVQGRGCMISDALEANYALVAFSIEDPLAGGASRVPYQVRAFLPRAALPDGLPDVDRYDTGCGEARLDLPFGQVADPRFHTTRDQFYGSFGPTGGARTYATYNAKAPYGNARYLLINTPGVSGGGVVRAVVRLGDLLNTDDRFGYCDPNFASTRSTPAASWMHGTVTGTRIAGWLPRRC